jgi:hypothetical protein
MSIAFGASFDLEPPEKYIVWLTAYSDENGWAGIITFEMVVFVGEFVVEVLLVTSVDDVVVVCSEVEVMLKVLEDVDDELDVEVLVDDDELNVEVLVDDDEELELLEIDEYVFVSVVVPDSVDCIEIGAVLTTVPLEISGELGDVKIDAEDEGLSWVVGGSDEPVAWSGEVWVSDETPVEPIADAELKGVVSDEICVESVSITGGGVDIDGPVLSELVGISVVEIAENVGMDSDETEAVFIIVDGIVSLEGIESIEMPVLLYVSIVTVESDDGVTDSIALAIVDSTDEGVNDVGWYDASVSVKLVATVDVSVGLLPSIEDPVNFDAVTVSINSDVWDVRSLYGL